MRECFDLPRIQVDSLIVDYDEAGEGVPIIFIPGLTEFKEAFSFQFRGLQSNYRVISYDVRRGLKRVTDYTIERLVADLRNFMRGMDLNSAVICGHSFGGLVAMQFALDYPEETKALILVSSFPAKPQDVSADRFTSWISAGGHPYHASFGAMVKLHMARLLGRKSAGTMVIEHQVAEVKTIAHQSAQVNRITVAERMKIIAKADFSATLGEIIAPTMIVAGAKDRSFFLSSAQALYEGIPDSSLEVIEDSAHFCFLTRHDQFNLLVDDFLSAHLSKIA